MTMSSTKPLGLKRLLVLCYEFPPLGGGGGRVAAEVAAALVQKGVEVKFLTGGMPHLPRSEMVKGVEVLRVCSGREREDRASPWEMLRWLVAAFPLARRLIRSWKPDLLHAHFAVPTGWLAWVLSKLTKVPYLITAHLGDVPGGVPAQTEKLFQWLYAFTVPVWRDAVATTAVSSFVSELALQSYGRYGIAPRVIFNGVELPSHLPPKPSYGVRLLMVGRLSLQKNPLLTIEALSLLREEEWQLTIIGDGPLKEATVAKIKEKGLEDRIVLRGWMPQRHVRLTMAKADVLLMPSLSEGLPVAGIEALSRAMVIVGSAIGGIRDLMVPLVDIGEKESLEKITEKKKDEGELKFFLNGTLFSLSFPTRTKSNAALMAEALLPFLRNRHQLQRAQQVSRRHASSFAWDAIVNQYYEVLEISLYSLTYH
jgi:glycosyltransferase involved in cell wall biosynthesis